MLHDGSPTGDITKIEGGGLVNRHSMRQIRVFSFTQMRYEGTQPRFE